MAIFGDLADMSTPEILTILGQRTGKLLFKLPEENCYELHLCEATLWSLQLNGTWQSELPAVFYHLSVLNRAREGRFEFINTTFAALEHQLDLPRQELLVRDDGSSEPSATAVVLNDKVSDKFLDNELPDKQTRFRLKPGQSQAVPENLQLFLQQSQALLARGSSAEEVAQALGISAMRAQIYFQRLRVLGQITPVRAYTAAAFAESGGTRAETQGGQRPLAAPTVPRPRQVITRDPYANATPDKPARSLIRRLLSALTLGAIR